MLLFICYSIVLDNTDISTLSKGKTSVSTNGIKVYNKEILGDKICRLTTANILLVTDKMEIEKAKVNLETDKARLFGKKNSLVIKREEFRTEIVILNVINVLVRGYQDPFLKLIQDKFKVKRLSSFDNLKENFQRFFTGIRYY